MYPRTLELTKQLVKLSSPSGHEETALRFTETWMAEQGFANITRTPLFTAGKISGSDSNRAVILCGHIDTVVAGDLDGWHTPPLEAVEQDGKLYGLGTTDMKAGLALQLVLASEAKAKHLPFDIWVAAVAAEEVDGTGAAAFVKWFNQTTSYKTTDCLITEPTDLERVEIGHRGSCFIEFTFTGQAGHASNEASYEASGMKLAQTFLGQLEEVRHKLREQYRDPVIGQPTVVPTVFSAGDSNSPNKTSDVARIILDVRTTPQLDKATSHWADELASQYTATWRFTEIPTLASLCDKEATLVKAVLQATGISEPAISHGATDQVSFQNAGINTAVFGPGEFSQAHTQNEYIRLDKLEKACALYQKIITVLS